MALQIPEEWGREAHQKRFEELILAFPEKVILHMPKRWYDMLCSIWHIHRTLDTVRCTSPNMINSAVHPYLVSYLESQKRWPHTGFNLYVSYLQTFECVESIHNGDAYIRLQIRRSATQANQVIVPNELVFDWMYSRHFDKDGKCRTRSQLLDDINRENVAIRNSTARAFIKSCFRCQSNAWSAYKASKPDAGAVLIPFPNIPTPVDASVLSSSIAWGEPIDTGLVVSNARHFIVPTNSAAFRDSSSNGAPVEATPLLDLVCHIDGSVPDLADFDKQSQSIHTHADILIKSSAQSSSKSRKNEAAKSNSSPLAIQSSSNTVASNSTRDPTALVFEKYFAQQQEQHHELMLQLQTMQEQSNALGTALLNNLQQPVTSANFAGIEEVDKDHVSQSTSNASDRPAKRSKI